MVTCFLFGAVQSTIRSQRERESDKEPDKETSSLPTTCKCVHCRADPLELSGLRASPGSSFKVLLFWPCILTLSRYPRFVTGPDGGYGQGSAIRFSIGLVKA